MKWKINFTQGASPQRIAQCSVCGGRYPVRTQTGKWEIRHRPSRRDKDRRLIFLEQICKGKPLPPPQLNRNSNE